MDTTKETSADPRGRSHQQLVAELAKPGAEILSTMDPKKMALFMRTMVQVIQVGLILDRCKKVIFYNQPMADHFKDMGEPPPPIIARGKEKLDMLTPHGMHILHMAFARVGESCELLDNLAMHLLEGKPFDRSNFVEELGDGEFYDEGLRAAYDISRDEVLAANIAKLRKRYGQKYSDAAAKARADKAESAAPAGDSIPIPTEGSELRPATPEEIAANPLTPGEPFPQKPNIDPENNPLTV